MAGSRKPDVIEEDVGEVLDFMRLLWALHHGLAAKSKRMIAELGVTSPQRLVVRIVGRRPGIAAGEIASTLFVDPSTLTGVLTRLEGRGFIERKTDRADARRALFSLTAKGRRLDQMKTGTVEEKVRATLGSLPPDKVAAARDVIGSLARALGE